MSLFYIITLIILVIGLFIFIYLGKCIRTINDSVESVSDSTTERVKMFDNMKRPNFFRRIYLKWNFEWRHLPRDIKIGLTNLYKWFNLIWSDRNWDHIYLLQMMKFKIEQMANYHESRQFYVGWENNVKWMRTSSRLLDKMIDSVYESEYIDYYDMDVYNKPSDREGFVEIEFETTWEDLDTYINRYPLQIDKVKTQYKKLKGTEVNFDNEDDKKYFAILLSNHNQKRCQTLLFKILNEKLQHWWD